MEALSRYRAAAQAGASAEELTRLGAGVDPEVMAIVRWSQTRARAARPQPDPAFADRLRRALAHAAIAGAPRPSAPPAKAPEREISGPTDEIERGTERPDGEGERVTIAGAVVIGTLVGMIVALLSRSVRLAWPRSERDPDPPAR